ncbi:beta-ketoacyl synthase N-terminal-like domain-containing protein [Sulfitobacter sp. HNIBRBA3233]|uniref:type I polyketide synthase n=1 Tax=Sulfitobacter marinivivus TaxID=3158558 RepID=UPI0032E011D9
MINTGRESSRADEDIAIVGMAVNVPGAGSLDAYWENLRSGISSIRKLSEQELLANGETPEAIARRNYVRAAADLEGFETFDADFFGFSPKDAAILDPQHRKFLEVAWEAMEQAGHVPETVPGPIGVYAGCGMGSYFYFNICSNPDLVDDVGMFLLRHTGNDKDFLSTRVSHVFDLKGPSVNLQTACSTSLVAIHYAAAALRAGEVDMALAGGVTIELPQGRGYLFKENEILSPDGECHAFDHRAQGTVFGSGAGCVALKRLSDAQADGDHIWAVIKGSAINNDGAAKAGYLAPSVDGQAQAIGLALAAAEVSADQIELVECHGTGTYLGDPIEVAALTEAYRKQTDRTGFCRIGSVKTNIGHLDTAAGVAGLVKAGLALHHEAMPPSLGFEAPNPAIAFDGSPFRVNDRLSPWPRRDTPRHAAINALGVGGTNAHMILAEAPKRAASEESDFPFHPLVISGRSKAALDANTAALAAYLRANPDVDLADVAYTLKQGRRGFARRRVVVAETALEAADLLEAGDTRRVFTHDVLGDDPEVVFMFPGGGAQYPGMARDLYETEPVFADAMDRGLDHLAPQLEYDIRALWLPEEADAPAAAEKLKTPSVQLPLIAITEYALAQLWMSWGVQPAAMVGHSMGENVAACLAGVMRFEDLIDLVLLRGLLFDSVPAGGMLSVPVSRAAIEPYLAEDLDIASVNGPELTAVSGPDAALTALAARLAADGIDSQRIAIDIAAHSRMLDPILAEYRGFLAALDLKAPQMPFWSNRTGERITSEQATDPDYWVEQLRHTVHFADCIDSLSRDSARVFLEVGPGKALSSLAQMSPTVKPAQVLSTLRHPDQSIADDVYFMGIIGRLWACGVEADWAQIWGEARRNRVVLPTYRFQRSAYFIEPSVSVAEAPKTALARIDDIADWGMVPAWRPAYADVDADLEAAMQSVAGQNWLVFADADGLADPVIARLRAAGARLSTVHAGDGYADLGEGRYTLAPEQGGDGYVALLGALAARGALPERIAHFWLVTQSQDFRPGSNFFERNVEQGFLSLLWLGKALADLDDMPECHLTVLTNGAARVGDEGLARPEKTMISGPLGVMPREIAGLTASTLDLVLPEPPVQRGFFARSEPVSLEPLVAPVLEELLAAPSSDKAALRGAKRYVERLGSRRLGTVETPVFERGGTYLITGGFGGIGRTVAADLLARFDARVVLLSRTPIPAREAWTDILQNRPASDPTARRIRAIERLESIGKGRVDVRTADVINVAQMRRVIDGLQSEGRINGVIHAAGALDDQPLLAKTQEQVDAVLAPKVLGLRVLEQLLPDGAVDLMVLFSSTSTAVRAAGQVDYVAANEYFNAFAKARQGGQTRVTAVNWGVWSDVGMAAEAVGAANVDVLPPRQISAPLLQTQQSLEGETRFAATLTSRDWVLDQHRMTDGLAVMPGTGMVEALAEAARGAGAGFPLALNDLYFLRPLTAPEGQDRHLRISLRRDAAGGYDAQLRSDCTLGGKAGWQIHAEARIAQGAQAAPGPVDLDAIRARLGPVERSDDRLTTPQEAHLAFGPQWHVLRARQFGDAEGLAHLRLDGAADDGHVLHPGLLDLATGWAVALARDYDAKDLWVPVSYGEIVVYAPLESEIFSHVRLCGSTGEARFDVTITDTDGRVLAEVRDFAMTRLSGGFSAQAAPLTAAEVLFDEAGDDLDRPRSEAEERLAYTVAQGITAREGPQALERAIAVGAPQIFVSSLPLEGLIAQANQPPRVAQAGQGFERSDLEGFVAPRNAVEEKLAAMWSQLLGVSPVGVEDSFFDLGGHSLIAVRLFAAVKREFGVEFPLSILFEAPTIAQIAARIGTGDAAQTTDGAKDETTGTFEHLVALNAVDPGRAPPMFIVAGMFGNVLNLRHLALQFGGDRAVYGVQARGLVGSRAPHTTVADAAADYLKEIKRVQPEGPYLLSGYSGGGITAYEMAQQLHRAGERVGVLALLDTPLPVRPALTRRDKAIIKLAELRSKGPRYLAEWARNRIAWEREKRAGAGTPQGTAPGAEFNNLKVQEAFLGAVGAYETPQWDGPMTLFRPPLDLHWKVSAGAWVSSEREYVLEDNDWRKHAPNLQVVEVPGDHVSMVLSPNVVVLGAELREIIAEALAGEEGVPQATAAE